MRGAEFEMRNVGHEKPVTLKSKWEDLNTPERWRTWLDIARKENPWQADYWSDLEGCIGCRYLDEKNVWCRLVELPATRNPVLNMLGMACAGFGRDAPGEQLQLNLAGEHEIPF